MPRSRGSELPQRPSPRVRASSSDSDPTHHRSRTTERSPRLSDGHPVNQRKLGSRIADLESQLGQAQGELKCLKDQLVSAEAAKRAAQQLLSRKLKRPPNSEKHSTTTVHNQDDILKLETDVFEVPAAESPESDEICRLRRKLDEKEKELEAFGQENVMMKRQLHDKSMKLSSAESQIEELSLRLKQGNQELEKSKTSAAQMNEKLGGTERAKEELENEMKMLRLQTEQWRKAADAAATVLAGEVEMNGRRCGSMYNAFEPVGGYAASPDDSDHVYGGGKRKGSGIKNLWRKKGNK